MVGKSKKDQSSGSCDMAPYLLHIASLGIDALCECSYLRCKSDQILGSWFGSKRHLSHSISPRERADCAVRMKDFHFPYEGRSVIGPQSIIVSD